MKQEIGGYLEFEHFTGKSYHEGAYAFNLGRTALAWLLEKLNCSKLYAPYYNCDSVANTAMAAGFDVEFFHIDEELKPVFDEGFCLGENEWIYLINYYGQLTADEIRGYQKRFGRIIVDNAQGYFDKPLDGIHTLYSCRKFLGVSDGAYLYTDLDFDETLPRDMSGERVRYLFGRLEENARTYYSQMLAESDKFAHAKPMKMSLLTENILRGIDDEAVRTRRLANYRTLAELLPSDNPFTKKEPFGPFAYPFYHENGVELRKTLAAENIFIPTNWSYLLKTMPEDSLEYQWSANILPLPVDQRYTDEEMTYLADRIKRF